VSRFRLAKKEQQGRLRPVAVLAGFAILCGLILLLAGTPTLSCGASQQTVGPRVLSALKATRSAERALESGNYGTARSHVRAASEALTEALEQLETHGR